MKKNLYESQVLLNFINEYVDSVDLGEELCIEDVHSEEDKYRYFIQNINLILWYLLKYHTRDTSIEDYFQECSITFLRTIDLFDPTLNNQFSTYFIKSMVMAIDRYKNENTFTLKIGINFNSLARKVKKLVDVNTPDTDIIAKLGITEDKLFEVNRFLSMVDKSRSLDADVIDVGGYKTELTLVELIEDKNDTINKICEEVDSEIFYNTIFNSNILTRRESEVIYKRYYENKTLDEVGKEYNITRERTRQIQNKALEKLRRGSVSKLLREFM